MSERQVSPTLEGIRLDHVNRYKWVKDLIHPSGVVLDAACGVGYGSSILSDKVKVKAVDIDYDAIAYAKKHYQKDSIEYIQGDLCEIDLSCDYCVAFEVIEHVENPLSFLKRLSNCVLFASVPNEDVFPYIGYKFHFRHYTQSEFESLLNQAGFKVRYWYGQRGKEGSVVKNLHGRTLIAMTYKK